MRVWFKRKFVIAIFIGIFLILAYTNSNKEVRAPEITENMLPTETIRLGGKTIRVEIAETFEKRQMGLSNRDGLGENEGMLFVFQIPGIHHFWMKDMNFPIDIIWIDHNKKIVDIDRNISPDTYPEQFSTSIPVNYVVEVEANFAENNGIEIGDTLLFVP